jgi:hypothetical protein
MLFREIVSLKFFCKKLPVFYSRSNESGLAPHGPSSNGWTIFLKKAEHMSCMVQYICIKSLQIYIFVLFWGEEQIMLIVTIAPVSSE